MTHLNLIASAGACCLLATATVAQDADVTADDLLQRLEGVAPPEVLDNSTLLHVTEDGEVQTLRGGTNGWTCLYPGTDPMCADAGGAKWMNALLQGDEAGSEEIGFIYMLLGDGGTSNIAPGATEETPDNEWVQTGPHVMLVGGAVEGMLADYPREPDPGKPFVMWGDTPYAHLMLPVE